MFVKYKKAKHYTCRSEGFFITILRDNTRVTFSYALTIWLRNTGLKYVIYLSDFDTHEIAFQPTEEANNCYKIQGNQRSQVYVSARTFLRHIGCPKPGRYDARVENGMIISTINS